MDQDAANMTPVSVRLPITLREQIRRSAQRNRRSLNSELVVMLEQKVQENEKADAAATASA